MSLKNIPTAVAESGDEGLTIFRFYCTNFVFWFLFDIVCSHTLLGKTETIRQTNKYEQTPDHHSGGKRPLPPPLLLHLIQSNCPLMTVRVGILRRILEKSAKLKIKNEVTGPEKHSFWQITLKTLNNCAILSPVTSILSFL